MKRSKAFEVVGSGHSATFALFHRAILERQQISCTYKGYPREICPHVLGHSAGTEKALVYQFGGESSRGLPARGEWRCLDLSEVRDAKACQGRWHSGETHRTTQRCVERVYVDVNTDVPDQPGRRPEILALLR
jgi:hypothetical protein